MYAYESADPVEEETFKSDGVEMSDFVYPAYFEDFHEPRVHAVRSFEKIKTPVQILPGGYQIFLSTASYKRIHL